MGDNSYNILCCNYYYNNRTDRYWYYFIHNNIIMQACDTSVEPDQTILGRYMLHCAQYAHNKRSALEQQLLWLQWARRCRVWQTYFFSRLDGRRTSRMGCARAFREYNNNCTLAKSCRRRRLRPLTPHHYSSGEERWRGRIPREPYNKPEAEIACGWYVLQRI